MGAPASAAMKKVWLWRPPRRGIGARIPSIQMANIRGPQLAERL
jgi:hypothetical protein